MTEQDFIFTVPKLLFFKSCPMFLILAIIETFCGFPCYKLGIFKQSWTFSMLLFSRRMTIGCSTVNVKNEVGTCTSAAQVTSYVLTRFNSDRIYRKLQASDPS